MLVVVPWTSVWQRNAIGVWVPAIGAWMASSYTRGAVTGVGLITVVAGLRDLTGAFLTGPRSAQEPPAGGAPSS